MEKFNNVECEGIPVKKISEMELLTWHTIKEVKRVTTVHGPTLLMTVSTASDLQPNTEEEEEVKFNIFLPKRFAEIFADEDITAINELPYHQIQYTGLDSFNSYTMQIRKQ